ncbi:YxlC family protein [Paenibacillus sp. FSL L8-0436]|uniref:YxlC family protein n=1 Tax=Paenibacillus sp. FSL L8-0436 TaxID=2954686 RepID=UPI00315855C4
MKPDDDELLVQLNAELNILDAQFDDISPPSLLVMEELIAAETLRRRRKSRNELLLFLCLALIVLSIILTALGSAPVFYWVLQAVFPLAALGSLGVSRVRLQREDTEE